MIYLNIHDAKTHLSSYLNRLAAGETIMLCKRNRPVAEIHAIPEQAQASEPRPIGLAAGRFSTPPSFFDELPADELDLFEGKSG